MQLPGRTTLPRRDDTAEASRDSASGRWLAGAFLVLALATLLTACATQPQGEVAAPAETKAATESTQTGAAQSAGAQLPTATPRGAGSTADANSAAAPVLPAVSQFDPAATPLALEMVIEGLDRPTFLTHAGDGSGRLFILEKPGRIRIYDEDALVQTPFLDITDRVGSSSNEQGLLGLAFAPEYASSGRFYVNYTDVHGDTVVARYQASADPNLADAASATTILTIDQPAPNHNGGMITFGPDGMLWVGMGDGGAAGDRFENGQNPATLLGKMLRIDVAGEGATGYTIPADNPWVEADWNGLDVRDEVWAVGLRNPWRFSFDRTTGDLWIADVGQDQYEEVNMVAAGSSGGLNFGWPIMEGFHCFRTDTCDQSGLTLPVTEYDHSKGCSVTGGYAYRGPTWASLQGVYFYADYCSGVIWALTRAPDGKWQSLEALQSNRLVTSFGEDEAGELYVVDDNGSVLRMTLTP